MLRNRVYETLKELSKGRGVDYLQHIFSSILSEIGMYLQCDPLYKEITVSFVSEEHALKTERSFILDFGVRRVVQEGKLGVKINEVPKGFLPFIVLREVYYSFIDKDASDIVKICINQIVENELSKEGALEEWKKLIRDTLVDREFLHDQLDQLEKFFKIEARTPFLDTTQFFFKEMRENPNLCRDNNADNFYDVIYESYTFYTSSSFFNPEIIEMLRILIHLFYESRSYIHLSEYQALFKKFKETKKNETKLSLRKFSEILQWINKSTSIAPSYDLSYGSIGLYPLWALITFNPLLAKKQITSLIEQWPFIINLKFSENRFATEIIATFAIPTVYIQDYLKFFSILEERGYIKKKLYTYLNKYSGLNLNYFGEKSNVKKIIDPHHDKYEKNLEIDNYFDHAVGSNPYRLSMFDYILLERVRHVSITGLTFDKRVETLRFIKEDIKNEIRKQKDLSKKFKDSFDSISRSPLLREHFLQILEKNKSQGFLYTYFQLKAILQCLDLFINLLNVHPEIVTINQLQLLLFSNSFSQTIEDHLFIRDESINKIVYRDFLSLYFQSKHKFREEVEKTQAFYNVLNACYNLKILDLTKVKKIAKNPRLVEEIFHTRGKAYEEVFKPMKEYKITNERITSAIETLIHHNPPVLIPLMINGIITSAFAKYFPEIILKNTPEVKKKLNVMKRYFPRIFIYETVDLDTKQNFIWLDTYFINIKEKGLFLSVLHSQFKDSIISCTRYFWRGFVRFETMQRELYDYKRREFSYSENDFKGLLKYAEKLLGDKLDWSKYPLDNTINTFLWSEEHNIDNLVNAVKRRISFQDIDFNAKELAELSDFIINLESTLMDAGKFSNIKTKKFFKRYIQSIRFLPAFQNFGFSQYTLYFRPFYYHSPTYEIDFRLLFINSFQKVRYPACIESNPALVIDYIFPFKTPNKSYLNWLMKSKQNVSEYCLFYKKKVYDIIHFDRNLTREGWNYSLLKIYDFKSYMEEVLFNPKYNPTVSSIRTYDLEGGSESYGRDSPEYNALTRIYATRSKDIKSYLGTRKSSIIKAIIYLLEKKLIFPYPSLKNLDFQEKILIILPEINTNDNETIIRIFSFFNKCRIYEIEGDFFVYGFVKEKPFENGQLIELWLPMCEVDEFFNVFHLLFQYLGIKHYIILTDLVKGNTLLQSTYGTVDFLKEYNPLVNFEWNERDKIWMNPKLFTE
ncbi:MAG: hypothetical protein ACFE94_19210, partial [Candidatus Hodarchaeota archaeon]